MRKPVCIHASYSTKAYIDHEDSGGAPIESAVLPGPTVPSVAQEAPEAAPETAPETTPPPPRPSPPAAIDVEAVAPPDTPLPLTNDVEVVSASDVAVPESSTGSEGSTTLIEADAGGESEVIIIDVKDEPPGDDVAIVDVPPPPPPPPVPAEDVPTAPPPVSTPTPSVIESEKSGESEQAAQEPPRSPVIKFVHFASDTKDPDAGNSKKKKKLLIGKGKPNAFVRMRDPPPRTPSPPKDEKKKVIDKVVRKKERRPSILSISSLEKPKLSKVDERKQKKQGEKDKKSKGKTDTAKSESPSSKDSVVIGDDAGSFDNDESVISEGSIAPSAEGQEVVAEEAAAAPPSPHAPPPPTDETVPETQDAPGEEVLRPPPPSPPPPPADKTPSEEKDAITEVKPAPPPPSPPKEVKTEQDEVAIYESPVEVKNEETTEISSAVEDTSAAPSPAGDPVEEGEALLAAAPDGEGDLVGEVSVADVENAPAETLASVKEAGPNEASVIGAQDDVVMAAKHEQPNTEVEPIEQQGETAAVVEKEANTDEDTEAETARPDVPNADEQSEPVEVAVDTTSYDVDASLEPNPESSGESSLAEIPASEDDKVSEESSVSETASKGDMPPEGEQAAEEASVGAPEATSEAPPEDSSEHHDNKEVGEEVSIVEAVTASEPMPTQDALDDEVQTDTEIEAKGNSTVDATLEAPPSEESPAEELATDIPTAELKMEAGAIEEPTKPEIEEAKPTPDEAVVEQSTTEPASAEVEELDTEATDEPSEAVPESELKPEHSAENPSEPEEDVQAESTTASEEQALEEVSPTVAESAVDRDDTKVPEIIAPDTLDETTPSADPEATTCPDEPPEEAKPATENPEAPVEEPSAVAIDGDVDETTQSLTTGNVVIVSSQGEGTTTGDAAEDEQGQEQDPANAEAPTNEPSPTADNPVPEQRDTEAQASSDIQMEDEDLEPSNDDQSNDNEADNMTTETPSLVDNNTNDIDATNSDVAPDKQEAEEPQAEAHEAPITSGPVEPEQDAQEPEVVSNEDIGVAGGEVSEPRPASVTPEISGQADQEPSGTCETPRQHFFLFSRGIAQCPRENFDSAMHAPNRACWSTSNAATQKSRLGTATRLIGRLAQSLFVPAHSTQPISPSRALGWLRSVRAAMDARNLPQTTTCMFSRCASPMESFLLPDISVLFHPRQFLPLRLTCYTYHISSNASTYTTLT
jgi:hypothetical protein